MTELTGRLENWIVIDLNEGYALVGYIHDDNNGRWEDGHRVITSLIQGVHQFKQGDRVKTRNSTYLLGKKAHV